MKRKWFIHLEFKPQDLWIGVFWKRTRCAGPHQFLDIWVCLLPMVPIHFGWVGR